MSLINLRDRTINAKIVFYGAALSGKTTSLKHVHSVIDPTHRTELVSLNTEGDRTLFFDFLPIPLGTLNGFEVKLQAFTVPGQVKYNLTRRYVLRGADAVIFVADSRPKAFDANIASLESLWDNLTANKIDADKVPLLIQYNKRDVPDVVEVSRLRKALNGRGFPERETIAVSGEGVFGGFAHVCCEMVAGMAAEYRFADPEKVRATLSERMHALEDQYEAAPRAELPHSSEVLVHPDEGSTQSAIISVARTSGADDDETPELEDLLERAVETNMESARLLAELHETRRRLADHVRELAALHETGIVISSELDEVRLMRRILSSSLATVGTEHGSVLLSSERDGRLDQVLVRGYEKDPLASGGNPDPAFVARVLARRAFALHAPADAALLTGGRGGPEPKCALVAPLAVKGHVLGALVAYLMDVPDEKLVPMRLRFLSAVATQASVALEKARLYAQVESFNKELEAKVEERTRELNDAYRKLQKLDLMKDDFLASMSHELLTPLTSISGFAEILVATAKEQGPAAVAERAEFGSIVQKESERLTDMLQRVLDLSMLESDTVSLEPEPMDLREHLLTSFKRFRDDFRAKGLKVRLRVAEGMPPVQGDPRWLRHVFEALLSNAVKFSPEENEVSITIQTEGAEAILHVEDRGPGVSPSMRGSVFEKFKQHGDVLNDKTPGLGLGLPMARMILERLGGRIWFEDGAETGTIFGIALPVAAVPAT